jgi:hypothetical protein
VSGKTAMLGGTLQRVPVDSRESLESAVMSYIAQGFVVIERGPKLVILHRRKRFQIIWAVIGLFLCIIPLIAYLLIYALSPDVETVQVVIE